MHVFDLKMWCPWPKLVPLLVTPHKELFVLSRSGFTGGRTEGCTPCSLYTVGMDGLCKGLCPFCSPRLPEKDLPLYSVSWKCICGIWAFAEVQPAERPGQAFPPREWDVLPLCAKRKKELGCLSTALRTAHQAVSRLTVTSSSAVMFGSLEVRKNCLTCPPRLLLLV